MTYYAPVFTYIHASRNLPTKMRVLERNASDGVNPIILIQLGSLYLTRLIAIDIYRDAAPAVFWLSSRERWHMESSQRIVTCGRWVYWQCVPFVTRGRWASEAGHSPALSEQKVESWCASVPSIQACNSCGKWSNSLNICSFLTLRLKPYSCKNPSLCFLATRHRTIETLWKMLGISPYSKQKQARGDYTHCPAPCMHCHKHLS